MVSKKSKENKGQSAPCTGSATLSEACVAQRVAQAVAHRPGPATRQQPRTRPIRRASRAAPAPYLWRRGQIFQFRRRLPQRLVTRGAPEFLSLSLRTNVLPEAMKRAAALIAAMERAEASVMAKSAVQELTPAAVTLIVREVAREALADAVRRDDIICVRSLAEADAARDRIAEEIAELRTALRLRDGTPAREATRKAMERLAMPANAAFPATVEREALGAIIDVRMAEAALEEGHSLGQATTEIRERRFAGAELADIAPPVMLAAAIAAAEKRAVSSDMARKFDAIRICALAWKGDMPLDLFVQRESVLEFLLWLRRLPKHHGKAHGRNRYEKTGVTPDKHAEIAKADERDRKIREKIELRADLDLRVRRIELSRSLMPRLSDQAIESHHARIPAIVDAAREVLGWKGPGFQSVLPEFRRRAKRADNRSTDPLDLRVTDTKKRSVWSLERIEKLLMSPIYTGCFSQHRRWRRGRHIVRDAMYWLPLIQITMGPRPEEAAALAKEAILVRDGIHCIRFEARPDARQKTESSERIVPLPDVLIRLGFVDWWREQLALPGTLLFPELPTGRDGKVSDLFGKRRTRIFAHLGIRDTREDFYAGRMTVSTQLLAAGAPDHVRQSVIGHEHGEIINRHYTEANIALMKNYLDRIDLGLVVEHDSRYGFPVIRRCTLLKNRPLSVTLTLDRRSQPQRIEVYDPSLDAMQVISADGAMDEADSTAVYANLQSMGSRLARALGGRRFRLEGLVDGVVECKMGLLLAVGIDCSERAPANEGGQPDSRCSGESHQCGGAGLPVHADIRDANERTDPRPRVAVRTSHPNMSKRMPRAP